MYWNNINTKQWQIHYIVLLYKWKIIHIGNLDETDLFPWMYNPVFSWQKVLTSSSTEVSRKVIWYHFKRQCFFYSCEFGGMVFILSFFVWLVIFVFVQTVNFTFCMVFNNLNNIYFKCRWPSLTPFGPMLKFPSVLTRIVLSSQIRGRISLVKLFYTWLCVSIQDI